MRILVTGGAGFLGSFLCENLIAGGDEVLCLDDFSSGSRDNLADLMDNPRFSLLEADATAPIHQDFDRIYCLACPASPAIYQKDPLRTLRTLFIGTMQALDAAARSGARVLFASTSEVYGDPDIHPQPETYRGNVNPVGLRSCYDEGKRVGETLMMEYRRMKGVPVRIVRIFNTYGPRMAANDGRVIPAFMLRALQGEDLVVAGDGSRTRSFCYVSDLTRGLVAMMENGQDFIGPVNLGNPEEVSLMDLAQRIVGLTGSSSRIVQGPVPEDDPARRRPDIRLAGNMLGWSPSVDLDAGLRACLPYFYTLAGVAPEQDPVA